MRCFISYSMVVGKLRKFFQFFKVYTLYLKSLSGHSSVCYKTSLNTAGGVGQAGAAPPTSKLEKF